MIDSRLTSASRTAALQRLRDSAQATHQLDILVIGGGVTGAGIALDAATRGLNTAVVEAQDWASGTSSKSSKLIHGGLRYLQMFDFKLVHEALVERGLLLSQLAPHLVKPVPFLYPLHGRFVERGYVEAGISLYDVLASLSRGTKVRGQRRRTVPWHNYIGHRKLMQRFPGLQPDVAQGAIQYWDASVDDARFVADLLRTAQAYGAHPASRTQVTKLIKNPGGAVIGAELVDLETGDQFEAHAQTVINATGVWTDKTEKLTGGSGSLHVLASKGVHIVVPRDRIDGKAGLILQTATSVLFVIPWSRYWIIGTTDTPWKEDVAKPVATSADIDYVLDQANSVLAQKIGREDIVGHYAGLRPLLQPGTTGDGTSAKISREHTVASPVPGVVSIAGGKFTTYRVMAKDAVDFALGERAERLPSVTANVPLVGAVGYPGAREHTRTLALQYGWDEWRISHLLHRYGAEIIQIAQLCADDSSMAKPLQQAPAYIRAEIAFAITHEGALHLDDILARRTRIVYEVPEQGLAAVDEIADIVAPMLGWSDDQREAEVDAYRTWTLAELAAIKEPDDRAAVGVREAVDELIPMLDGDSTQFGSSRRARDSR
ncbi:glycerol-3-phosphate dehydrogenase/oxidase [Microlunatus elymi]|uniref:Glycerol-3-phosphate dehydrogenase n=1 Tax=Microlunatus elymi TaxID=2596828 RepID=A0A516PXE5_9ACTN|nr:glycerol-3-phosphate dehydrogenase/oxidase [Microlunatus elymi]QDP95836.1 glycerol-3-phosphate dehydrogenase/oxidase [Microlunatus elymi]